MEHSRAEITFESNSRLYRRTVVVMGEDPTNEGGWSAAQVARVIARLT
jgi:hypothetical protein